MGVTVPPAFVSFNDHDETCGALIEWFYKPEERDYISAGDLMSRAVPEYDLKKGKKHNFDSMIDICEKLLKAKAPFKSSITEHWAKVFTFDSLIGNTDRHHDNWGIIVWSDENDALWCEFSPAFDNGTSMGYEILNEKLKDFVDARIDKYIDHKRATHHIKFTLSGERMNHRDFLKEFMKTSPVSTTLARDCLNFDFSELEKIVEKLTQFDISVPLSEERAQFMLRLVKRRQTLLIEDMRTL